MKSIAILMGTLFAVTAVALATGCGPEKPPLTPDDGKMELAEDAGIEPAVTSPTGTTATPASSTAPATSSAKPSSSTAPKK